MNKYIRLKDKIVKIEAEDDECYYFNKLKKFVYKDESYKIADTIKDLCDGYFIKFTNDFKPYEIIYETALVLCKNTDDEVEWIKGVIFTKDSIKYVAKMNEEGNLKLI